MTELFTEQARFAKANNHVYVNGTHYDEAKAQRDLEAKPSWMSQELYDLLE